jgi:hypothetical protein
MYIGRIGRLVEVPVKVVGRRYLLYGYSALEHGLTLVISTSK